MRTLSLAGLALAALATLQPLAAHAGANDSVHSPIVEEGEKELELSWGTQRLPDGTSATAASVSLGVGVNSWWFTELSAKVQRVPGERMQFDAWEWENIFQLTERGRYPVDVGFLLEIERPQDRAEGYELTYGPLLQAEWGRVQGNLNLLLRKHVRASEPFDTEFRYEAQLKYRHSESLEWGVQALGSTGQWDRWSNWNEQTHQMGPALFGKIKMGDHHAVKWNAALLHGFTDVSPKTTLRMQAEFEF